MASPPGRFSVPPPRRDSGSVEGASSTPRSSDGQPQSRYLPQQQAAYTNLSQYRPDSSASSSRRHSNASLKQSPTSLSSHSHHDLLPHAEGSGARGAANANAPHSAFVNGQAEYGQPPRIRTSYADGSQEERPSGPRSAPINGPLRPPSEHYPSNTPIRSSSSPDPWLSHPASRGSSPNHSPIDHRPNFASHPAGSSARPYAQPGVVHNGSAGPRQPHHPGNILIPPRSSSQTEHSRPITPESNPSQSHDSHDHAATP